jgi:hypothetical protein
LFPALVLVPKGVAEQHQGSWLQGVLADLPVVVEPLLALLPKPDCSVNGILKPLIPTVKLSCLKGQQGRGVSDPVPQQCLPRWDAEINWEDQFLATD